MNGTVVYFDKLFIEATGLIIDARDYAKYYYYQGCDEMSAPQMLQFISESTRMTSRLLIAMSWIMQQRSVARGVKVRAQKQDINNIMQSCIDTNDVRSADILFMPSAFCTLVERSNNLFLRVKRLHNSLRQKKDIIYYFRKDKTTVL